ncbi:hypothetical protein ACFX2A_010872 [Malus domestica]
MVPNKSFNSKTSPTKASLIKASSMEYNYKFLKASHYLDQDSVKQNQFMVPNESLNSKASPTKLQLQSFTYKSFNTKALPTKASTQKLYPQNFNTKASPIKASSMEDNYKFSKASHTLDQDNVKQNQFIVPTRASSKEGNHISQKLHTLLIKTV